MRLRHSIALLLAASMIAPVTAAAAWGSAEDIAPVEPGHEFAYDGNARGDRVAVWQTDSGFAFALARAGRRFRAVHDLPGHASQEERNPRVELDERGNALLLWTYFDGARPEYALRGPDRCCDGLRARVIRRDGSVSPVKTLAPRGRTVGPADMQIAADGTFGIVFQTTRNRFEESTVQARFGTLAAGFGPREGIGVGAGDAYGLHFVRGRARVQYPTGTGWTYGGQRVAMREAERLGPRRWRRLSDPLPAGRQAREEITLATAPGGEQAITWVDAYRGSENQRVHMAVRAPGRRFRTRTVAKDNFVSNVPVAIAPGGTALAAWGSVGGRSLLSFLEPARAAGVGEVSRVGGSLAEEQFTRSSLDVDQHGWGLVAWVESPGNRTGARLLATWRSPYGTAGVPHEVVTPREGVYAIPHAVSLDRTGLGHVAYAAGGRLQVVAARP